MRVWKGVCVCVCVCVWTATNVHEEVSGCVSVALNVISMPTGKSVCLSLNDMSDQKLQYGCRITESHHEITPEGTQQCMRQLEGKCLICS